MNTSIYNKLLEKFQGIFPAFYACYDQAGNISPQGIRDLTSYLLQEGVNGLYVGGSSGECIYQSVEERQSTLEIVLDTVHGQIPVIAHVAANSTKDSRRLAAHAEQAGADAIAAIPPIYFRLPDYAIRDYWNAISEAAPQTPFVIYNIPQLAGVALTPSLLEEMLDNERVIGVKNSSMPPLDIALFLASARKKGRKICVFNGPDEQLLAGLSSGAQAGIGGTYGLMPDIYLAIYRYFQAGLLMEALQLQEVALDIVLTCCRARGSLYAVIKEVLKREKNLDLGGVRPPLPALSPEDEDIVEKVRAKLASVRAKVER